MASNPAGAALYRVAANDLLRQAHTQAAGEAQRALKHFADTFSRPVYRNRHTRIKTLFNAAAVEASASIVRAYKSRPYKTRSSIEMSPYRNNHRFSGGKLAGALASPAMYKVTETGIQFINVKHLDVAARQWQRLNFGAGARGSQTPAAKHYKMRLFGQTLPGDFGLFSPPRPAFQLPAGFWSSSYPQNNPVQWNASRRGQDFFIMGTLPPGPQQTRRGNRRVQYQRLRPTTSLGIQGSRFLDVGVGRLTQTFPVAIEKLITEWFTEAKETGGGPVYQANVKATASEVSRAHRVASSYLQRSTASSRGRFINRY